MNIGVKTGQYGKNGNPREEIRPIRLMEPLHPMSRYPSFSLPYGISQSRNITSQIR